jgi:hypothetical protein
MGYRNCFKNNFQGHVLDSLNKNQGTRSSYFTLFFRLLANVGVHIFFIPKGRKRQKTQRPCQHKVGKGARIIHY